MENIDLLTENKNLLRSTEHLSLQIAAVEEASGKKNEYCEKRMERATDLTQIRSEKRIPAFRKGFLFVLQEQTTK